MFKVGELVRVLRDKLPKEDEIIVDEHGYLWFITHIGQTGRILYCKSLATGATDHVWFPNELEKADV